MIKALDLFGRVLISALFFLNGIFKINNYEGTIGWMESFGLPGILIIPAIARNNWTHSNCNWLSN